MHVFFKRITKISYIFRNNARISALDTNIDNFQQISVKYLPFPHPSISLMTKDFAQNKAYNYFSTGDAKALV